MQVSFNDSKLFEAENVYYKETKPYTYGFNQITQYFSNPVISEITIFNLKLDCHIEDLYPPKEHNIFVKAFIKDKTLVAPRAWVSSYKYNDSGYDRVDLMADEITLLSNSDIKCKYCYSQSLDLHQNTLHYLKSKTSALKFIKAALNRNKSIILLEILKCHFPDIYEEILPLLPLL
jgi:hypothetical protein